MDGLKTIIDEDLPMQVDCIHWNSKHSLIAVGAYKLEETEETNQVEPNRPQTRVGRIYLLKLTPSIPGGFTVTDEIPTPSGVLDLKWEPIDEELLSVATATSLTFYKIDETEKTIQLKCQIQLNLMALFVQWIDKENLIFSDSQGNINICAIQEQLDIANIKITIKVHTSLTWVVHYSHHQDVIYCGDDGGTLECFPDLESLSLSTRKTTKTFPMGLTSITTKNELVAIGSYDDTLKIYSLTQTTPDVILILKYEINLGGAVWRTQWLPNSEEDGYYIAAACARNGIKLIKISNGQINVEKECVKYKGFLAYGLHVHTDYKNNTFAFYTCYFDNHVVHVFHITI